MINGIGSSTFLNLNAVSRVTNAAAVNQPLQNTPTADASSKVTFSDATAAISAVYQIVPARVVSTANISQGLQTLTMGAVQSQGVGMNGVGSALLAGLTRHRDDTVMSVASAGQSQSSTKSALVMNITTQSGVNVSLQMTRQDDGIAIELKTTHGTLSDDEAAAIAKLSGALQKTLDGLDNSSSKIDVSDLLNFDKTQLKSIDLKTDLRRGNTVLQSLNLYADNTSRSLAFRNSDVSFKLSTDLTTLSQAGDASQQQRALDQWSDKFEKAALRGQGDRTQLTLFKDSFVALNNTANAAAASKTNGVPPPISIGSNAAKVGAISGLADFTASYQQTPRSVNPMKPGEQDTFSLDVSQKSSQQKSGVLQTLTQDTLFKLQASYHTALDPGFPLSLNEMKSSQNYRFHRIDDEERSQTTATQDAHDRLTAHSSQQLTQKETVKTYQYAKLIDTTETPHTEQKEATRTYLPELLHALA